LSRRVVVTGIGAMSPNGLGREAFAQQLDHADRMGGGVRLERPVELGIDLEVKGLEFAALRLLEVMDDCDRGRRFALAVGGGKGLGRRRWRRFSHMQRSSDRMLSWRGDP